jgi:hypothetical protein
MQPRDRKGFAGRSENYFKNLELVFESVVVKEL